MNLISGMSAAWVVAASLALGGCERQAGAPMPGDGTYRTEKARAQAAREVAEQRCQSQAAAAREDCLTRAEDEYERLLAAAGLRRDAREVELPEIAKTR